ncbi:TBC1D25 family protein [Megaselia abdita]
MSGVFSKDAVRVKVKKIEENLPVEWRKFSVDPSITNIEILYSLLAKAFDIKSDFSITYKGSDQNGIETHFLILTDWDLESAILRSNKIAFQHACEPYVDLEIEVIPQSEVKEFVESRNGKTFANSAKEIISPIQQSIGAAGQKYVQNMQTKLPGLIMNQMEKTFSIMQKAFNLNDEEDFNCGPPRSPLSDNEFRSFLDSVGQITQPSDLRRVIFFGGIEPSLRKVVWKHLLHVYPAGMSGRQRMDYMKAKSQEYYRLRSVWKDCYKNATPGQVSGELGYVTGMVKKDVLRTDRLHPFYAGNDDDNPNITALFNILTTYAINHPSVSYCQGMSDIASPLLVTMKDEASAYICFCAIMLRLRVNFLLDGVAMTQKFAHLAEAINFYDPEFFDYLKSQQADDLLFCYRWLLLELKREFPFDDSLRMSEVQWSALKSHPQINSELPLIEKEFTPPSSEEIKNAPASRENHFSKVCALRRQNSSSSSLSSVSSLLDRTKRLNQSMDDEISKRTTTTNSKTIRKSGKHQSLDESKMLKIMEVAKRQQQLENKTKDEQDDFVFHPTNPFHDENEDDVFLPPDCKNVFVDSLEKIPSIASEEIVEAKMVKSASISSPEEGSLSDKKKVGGHFKDLKDMIASKKGANFRTSFDTHLNKLKAQASTDKSQKIVKNFNEFLDFTKNSKISDKITNFALQKQTSLIERAKVTPDPVVKLARRTTSSIDEDSIDSFENGVEEHIPVDSCRKDELQRLQFEFSYEQLGKDSLDALDDLKDDVEEKKDIEERRKTGDVFVWENPLREDDDTATEISNTNDSDSENIEENWRGSDNYRVNPFVCKNYLNDPSLLMRSPTPPVVNSEDLDIEIPKTPPTQLPPPNEFGAGNPFLIFLCLTLLLQHRNTIMKTSMDYNEIAMNFDKMVRKHDVNRVLNQARRMYIDYLKSHQSSSVNTAASSANSS